MSEIRSRKAPGLDGITGSVVKEFFRAAPDFLMTLMRRCLDEGVFPASWKAAKVMTLLKATDKPKELAKSYRPICLLSAWGKILEKIMVRRLREDCADANSQISPMQFGFTAGKSTVDAWLKVVEYVRRSTSKYVLGLFVDFTGAFDNISWDAIFRRLVEIGARDLGLWKSYFKDRKVTLEGHTQKITRGVSRGCPQGSICGPFIWNLMMDPLLRQVENQGAFCVAYADDLLILVEADSRVWLERKGTQWMDVVRDWAGGVNLTVSEAKSVCMLLKGILSNTRPPWVRNGPRNLPYQKRTKYLGITVAERLNFLPHFQDVRLRLIKITGQFKRVLRKKWGPSLRNIRTWWSGLLSAVALYGAEVWFREIEKGYIRRAVERCQRIVTYAILPFCRTVSTEAMQVLLGELPWHLQAIGRGILYEVRNHRDLPDNGYIGADDLEGLTTKQKKNKIFEKLHQVWADDWRDTMKGRVTYRFVPDPKKIKTLTNYAPTMEELFIFTGHGSMNAYLYDRNLSDTPECDCGAPNENWQHILNECPLYDELRTWDPTEPLINLLNNSTLYLKQKTYCAGAFELRKMRGIDNA